MEELPLRDIHLPAPIGWWPPAIGWWILAILLPLLIFLVYRMVRKALQKTPIDDALQQLDDIGNQLETEPLHAIREMSILLKRSAVTLYPRDQTAGLTGREWLLWLDSTLGDDRFTNGPGQLLEDAPYRRESKGQAEQLYGLCRVWLLRQGKTRYGKRYRDTQNSIKKPA